MAKKIKRNIKRFLLLRPDAIGDVVLTIPAINAIRRQYPDAYISVMLRSYTADLLRGHPAVNDVVLDPLAEGKIKSWKDFLVHVSELRKNKYDAIVWFFHSSSHVVPHALAAVLAGIPIRVGDRSKIFLNLLYTHGFFQKWNDFTRHQVEHNLELVSSLGVDISQPEMSIYPDMESQRQASLLLHQAGICADDFVVGMHLGANTNKGWPPEEYAEVINRLSQEHNLKWIVTGGKSEEHLADTLLKNVSYPVINLVGKTGLGELIGVMERYNLYMSTDTGPFHIAAALKIPTVMISTSRGGEPCRWGPWGTRHVIVRKPLYCPIECLRSDCSLVACKGSITASDVVSAAKELIGNGGFLAQTDAFREWCKKSLNILAIGNSEKAKVFVAAAKEQGLNIIGHNDDINGELKSNKARWFFSRELLKENTNRLMEMVLTNNIRVIHFLDNNPPLWVKFFLIEASKKMFIPPYIIKKEAFDISNTKDLLDCYIRGVRRN